MNQPQTDLQLESHVKPSRRSQRSETALAAERMPSVTIGRPLEEVDLFLRDLSNLPFFMPGVAHASAASEGAALWRIRYEDGSIEEWESSPSAKDRDAQIAWRAVDGGAFRKAGVFRVERAPASRGTIVSLRLEYESTAAQMIAGFGKIVGQDPDSQAAVCLRRLKAYLECGEVPTVKGQPSGREADQSTQH